MAATTPDTTVAPVPPATAPAPAPAPAPQPLSDAERQQRFTAELQELSNKYNADIVAEGHISKSDTGVLSVFGVCRVQLRRAM